MFRKRLITSLVLIPLVLLGIYYAPASVLGIFILILAALASFEWLPLIPIHNKLLQIGFMFLIAVSIGLCYLYFDYYLIIGLLIWLVNIIAIISYPESKRFWAYPITVAAIGLLLIPLLIVSFAILYQQPEGKDLLVYIFCVVWAADSGAYLAGKRFGKRKLIPQVSPGKTYEGVLGGMLLAMLIAILASLYFLPKPVTVWLVLAMATILISIIGDLFISMLKRRSNLKDSGQVFPGHGGVLDRFDSMMAALPMFCFGLEFLKIGN